MEIVMVKPKFNLIRYIVPIIALLVVILHFILTKTTELSPWKGGGFGMYAEVHYYYSEFVITNLNKSLDSIIKQDRQVAEFVMDVKRSPNNKNLKHMAELVSKYATNDTITVQLWRPKVDSNTETYSRELINHYQFIKP